MLGSTHFTIGVAHAYGGQLGYLALAAAAAPAGTFIGPLPILIAPDPIPLLFPVNIQGPAIPGAGYASINTTIADNPGLAGASFYAQWLLFDPFAPVGLTVSDAARLTFFAP
jgi:hypothetical protein